MYCLYCSCQTQMFSVYIKNKDIFITVPTLLEGVYVVDRRPQSVYWKGVVYLSRMLCDPLLVQRASSC